MSLGSPRSTRSLVTASDKDSSTTNLLLYPKEVHLSVMVARKHKSHSFMLGVI